MKDKDNLNEMSAASVLLEQLAQLRAENEKIRAELQEVKEKSAPKKRTTSAPVHPPEYYEERVPVHLFKDGNKYKDDVTVIVNGETAKIQRGKTVMVKRKFADVLQQSFEQDATTADLMTDLHNQFERDAPNFL